MQPKVSIIIPVFNVESYLCKSLDSVLKQTLKEIEIIIINDGSTDNSLKICRKFERKDKRIKLINQVNKGVSAARNVGLKMATGEYIGFVDPDDWIEPTMFEYMYKSTTLNNAELTMCEYLVEKGKDIELKPLNFEKLILEGSEIRDLLIGNLIGANHLFKQDDVIMGSVCRLLVKRSTLEYLEIEFNEDIALMEDLIFCIEYLIRINKVSIVRKPLYHYVKNNYSAVNSYRENKEDELKLVFHKIKDLLERENIYNDFLKKMEIRYIRIYLLSITNEANIGNPKRKSEKISSIKQYCNNKTLNKYIQKVDTRNYSIKHRILLFLVNRKYAFIIYYYYMIINKKKNKSLG